MSGDEAGEAIIVGTLVGPFGLRGECKVAEADPADLRVGLTLRARTADGAERALSIESIRPHGDRLLVRFAGIDDADAVGPLRGARLLAMRADLPPLPEKTYRDEDLIGLRVVDSRLGDLGDVRGVLHYPHADMLVVGGRSLLVPVIAAYHVKVDRAARVIASTLPDGFEDLL